MGFKTKRLFNLLSIAIIATASFACAQGGGELQTTAVGSFAAPSDPPGGGLYRPPSQCEGENLAEGLSSGCVKAIKQEGYAPEVSRSVSSGEVVSYEDEDSDPPGGG